MAEVFMVITLEKTRFFLGGGYSIRGTADSFGFSFCEILKSNQLFSQIR